MKKMLWIVVAGLLAALLLGAAAADELAVGTASGYTSLTEAVQAAAAGDTIRIAAGTYTEAAETFPIEIDKPLCLIGETGAVLEGPAFATILSVSAPDVTIQGLGFRLLRWGIRNTGDRLRLIDCTFTMYDDACRVSSCAVWLGGVRDCSIAGCRFEKCGPCIAGPPLTERSTGKPVLTGLFEVGDDGAYFTSHTITDNTVNGKPLYYFINETDVQVPADAGGVIAACCEGVTAVGLDVSDTSIGMELAHCTGVRLDGITADRCGIFGIYLAYCDGGCLTQVSCSESNHGIDIRACNNIGVTGCGTPDCEQGIFLSFATECIVDDCDMLRCGNGFFTAAGTENQLSGSRITANENGVYIQQETNMLVCGNTISQNTVAGVRVLRSAAYLTENMLQGNQTGVLAAEADTLTLWGNTFSGNLAAGLYLRDIAAGKISGNLFDGTETVCIELEGTITNTMIWQNTFRCGRDRILDHAENMVSLDDNSWSE